MNAIKVLFYKYFYNDHLIFKYKQKKKKKEGTFILFLQVNLFIFKNNLKFSSNTFFSFFARKKKKKTFKR